MSDNAANLWMPLFLSEVKLPVDLLLSSFIKGTSSCGVSLFESGFIWTSERDLKDIWKSLGLFKFIVI